VTAPVAAARSDGVPAEASPTLFLAQKPPMKPIAALPLLAALAACASDPVTPPDAAVTADVVTADVVTADTADAGACDRSTDQPRPRGDAAGAVDPVTGALYVFGGDVGPVISCMAMPAFDGETWRFDPRCSRWDRLAPTEHPGPRARTAYALDARRRRMLVFGGRSRAGSSGAYTLYRDLWSLDLATGAWALAPAQADGPAARANATLAVDDTADAAVLFGGNTSTDGARFVPRNDTWRLDLATLVWSRVASDRAPPARQFHAAAAVRGGVIVVGGGDANAFVGPFIHDAWRFDVAAGQWAPLALADDGAVLGGRISHGLVARADDVALIGGHDDGALGNRNDVLTVDAAGVVTGRAAGDVLQTPGRGFCDFPADFARQDGSAPERRSAFVLAPDPTRDRVIVYGGKTDCGTATDVWSLDLRTFTWTPLRAATDGLSCGRTGRDQCRGLCS
jgi:hypothetical protein